MRILTKDLWEYHAQGAYVVITTNRCLKRDGRAVMGAGVALQAATRYPELPYQYAEFLRREQCVEGEGVGGFAVYPGYRLILLPTKLQWRDPSHLWLIEWGLQQLVEWQLGNPGA